MRFFADELLRTGRGLLLDFDAWSPLRALASRWSGRIAYVAGDVKDRLGLSAVLVRPDGFVAWAGEAAPDLAQATQAARRNGSANPTSCSEIFIRRRRTLP
ncbi:hypothetical protein [Bradyrhizobium genosp. P]|uniref:aromatic-ring hydroxylase C-terminal domain-containing protein n=1 Tax=Bradyrhizobium genosp. P TaxID=83641 RepID=UPI003CF2BF27